MENKPQMKIRAGSLVLTVWNNTLDNKDASYKTVTLSRNYKGKEGDWKSTNNLRMSDIPKAIAILKKAYEEEFVKVIKE